MIENYLGHEIIEIFSLNQEIIDILNWNQNRHEATYANIYKCQKCDLNFIFNNKNNNYYKLYQLDIDNLNFRWETKKYELSCNETIIKKMLE